MRTKYQNDFEFRRLFRAYPRFLQFQGRSTRTELIGYWIATWVISYVVIFVMIGGSFSTNGQTRHNLVAVLAYLIFYIPAPALHIRRTHDVGFPTAVGLLTILPTALQLLMPTEWGERLTTLIILSFVSLASLVFLLWKPQEGSNEYGPDPRLDQ